MLEALPLPALPAAASAGLPWGETPANAALPTAGAPIAPSPFAQLLQAQVPMPATEPAATDPTPLAALAAGLGFAGRVHATPGHASSAMEPEPAAEPAPPAQADALPAPAADPALLAQLAWMSPPPPVAEPVAPASGSSADAAAAEVQAPRPLAITARELLTAEAHAAESATPKPEAAAAAATAPQLTALALPVRERPAAPRAIAAREESTAHALAGLGATHGHPALRGLEAAADPAPASAAIAAPVESPEFAAELAARVSVLARDGVQRAELRLNPAELGPLAVQIAIDGTQARIDFGAEMLVTRHAIESSLPTLAASLREAGLTLAGGGVSQQMPGQAERRGSAEGDGSGTGRGNGLRRDEPVVSGVTTLPRRLRIGGVDLYA